MPRPHTASADAARAAEAKAAPTPAKRSERDTKEARAAEERAPVTRERASPRVEPVAVDLTDVRQKKSEAAPSDRAEKARSEAPRADATGATTKPSPAAPPRTAAHTRPAEKQAEQAKRPRAPAPEPPAVTAPPLPAPKPPAASKPPAAPAPKPSPAQQPSPEPAPTPSAAKPPQPPLPDARAAEETDLREREEKVHAATEPSPERASGRRGGGSGAELEWLPFVRAEGAASGAPSGDARYISDRSKAAPEEKRTRSAVNRSNGDGTGDAEIAERTTPNTRPVLAVDAPEAAPAEAPARSAARALVTPDSPPARTTSVALPYLSPSPAPAPSSTTEGMRLSAGEIPAYAEPAVRGDEAVQKNSPRARAPRPSARPIRAPAVPEPSAPVSAPSTAPIAALPPAPVRPALEDDFWASTAPETAPPGPVVAPSSDAAIVTQNDAQAQGWSDLAILDERVALADTSAYGARAHPLGAWLTAVDDQIRQRWVYPPALRALGQQGTVVVRFYVARSGLVTQAQVRAGSGWPELDLAALSAIPARVSAMPSGNGAGVWLQWTFRYRADRP